MKMEPIIAPTVPNKISPTAAIDIERSAKPNGFIKKFALPPKIKNDP
jgi:hypothetical protein